MIRRPPRSTQRSTLFPYTTLFDLIRVVLAILKVIRPLSADFEDECQVPENRFVPVEPSIVPSGCSSIRASEPWPGSSGMNPASSRMPPRSHVFPDSAVMLSFELFAGLSARAAAGFSGDLFEGSCAHEKKSASDSGIMQRAGRRRMFMLHIITAFYALCKISHLIFSILSDSI